MFLEEHAFLYEIAYSCIARRHSRRSSPGLHGTSRHFRAEQHHAVTLVTRRRLAVFWPWKQPRWGPEPPGGLGYTHIAAVGNRDAWIVAATQGLAGHVDVRVWNTNAGAGHWHLIAKAANPNTTGLAFATGSFGVLTEGGGFEPNEAPLAMTTNGRDSWWYLGAPRSPRPALPLLLGDWWPATVLAPSVVPHTQDVVVPVLMQRLHPSRAAPMRTWWRLEETTSDGQTWQALPTTPHPILPDPPSLIFQAWNNPQAVGWS